VRKLGTLHLWTISGWPHRLPVITNLSLNSQARLVYRTLLAEFGAPNVAAHCGQAAMPRVAHDLFVRHAISVGGRHEPGAQAVRGDRLRQRASLDPALAARLRRI
jgi:hypothetical protein